MYVNTLISLQENIPTYGLEGKSVTGHVTISTPGIIRCYVQNLKKTNNRVFELYVLSSKKNTGAKIGELGAEKETKWRVDDKHVMGGNIALQDIDGVAIVVNEGDLRSVDAILTGFKDNRFTILPILEAIIPKTKTETSTSNVEVKANIPSNPNEPPRPGNPGGPNVPPNPNVPPRPGMPGGPNVPPNPNVPPRPGNPGGPNVPPNPNVPPRPGMPGNPTPPCSRPDDAMESLVTVEGIEPVIMSQTPDIEDSASLAQTEGQNEEKEVERIIETVQSNIEKVKEQEAEIQNDDLEDVVERSNLAIKKITEMLKQTRNASTELVSSEDSKQLEDSEVEEVWNLGAIDELSDKETPEEIDFLEEIEKKLHDIESRLKEAPIANNKAECKEVQNEEHIENKLEDSTREDTTQTQLEEIYAKGEVVESFIQEPVDTEWVKIPYKEFLKIPGLSKQWCTQPFITFAVYKYNEILLGHNGEGKYYLGIPDIYHPDRKSILSNPVPVERFLCRRNMEPVTGEYGYWIIPL